MWSITMVKKRIIATIILKNNLAVQSIGFKEYLPIGKPEIAAEFLNEWGIDEIALIDIDASREGRLIDINRVKKVANAIFTPLSVGGGIQTLDDIKRLLDAGADKVIINQSLKNSNFIEQAVDYFGKQCIVASLDVMPHAQKYYLYDYLTQSRDDTLQERVRSLHVGEFLINVVTKDGKKTGYDIALYNYLTSITDTPIVALGGAKDANDIKTLFDNANKISAASAANFFHYMEHSVAITKAYLKSDLNRPIRHDGSLQYANRAFDETARVLKQEDETLANMLFEYHEKERI